MHFAVHPPHVVDVDVDVGVYVEVDVHVHVDVDAGVGVDVDEDGDGGFGLFDQDMMDTHLTDGPHQHDNSDVADALIEHGLAQLHAASNSLCHDDNDDVGDDDNDDVGDDDDDDDGLQEQDVPELSHHDGDGSVGQCMIKLPHTDDLCHHGDDGGMMKQGICELHSDADGREDGSLIEEDVIKLYLTDDLLHLVFSFLDQNSLCLSAMVCRQWHMASLHQEFWQSLSFVGEHVTGEKVGWLCLKYPGAIGLSLKEVPCVEEVAREAMYSLRGLKRLELRTGILTDSFFTALADGCGALQELSINDVVLGNGWSEEVLICHESLNQLEIIGCKVRRIIIRCPLLSKLSLKRTTMSYITLLCPILHSLDVSSCPKLSDANILSAISACSLLSDLDVSHSSCVTDATVQGIASVCRNLRMLEVSQCPNLTMRCAPYPILRGLRLETSTDMRNTPSFLLPMYESIKPDLCTFLTSATLDLQLLHSLTLRNFHKFIDSILRHPLKISINLSTSFMMDVNISPLALQRLLFCLQPSFTTMSLQNSLHKMKLPQSDFSEKSILRSCTKGVGYYGLTSFPSTHYQELRLIASNYVIDAALCMTIPSNHSHGRSMLHPPLKMLKLNGFVRLFWRIDLIGVNKGYDHFQKRKQLCLWLSAPKKVSKVETKELAFCFQIQMHKKHGFIMSFKSKLEYFRDTIKSFNCLQDSFNDDNCDPGNTSLNVLKYLEQGAILNLQHSFSEDKSDAFCFSGVQNLNNTLNCRLRENLVLLYCLLIQIWRQEIKLQDYLHVKSGSLVEYSFVLHYLEGSRVSYDFVRNLYGCVKDCGRQPLLPDSVFASMISQFTNWNGFPFSRQFDFRGMNGNLSIDVPILVNGIGVSAVSLDLRTLLESDSSNSPQLFKFSLQVALRHNLDNQLIECPKIKAQVSQYLIFDVFQESVLELAFMLRFEAFVFSWAQKELFGESMDPLPSICTPAFLSKPYLDLLPLEIMCNLVLLHLPCAELPDTLPAMNASTQLMKLAVSHLTDIMVELLYTKRESLKMHGHVLSLEIWLRRI